MTWLSDLGSNLSPAPTGTHICRQSLVKGGGGAVFGVCPVAGNAVLLGFELTLWWRRAVMCLRRIASPTTICWCVHGLGRHPITRRGLCCVAHWRCHVTAGICSGPAEPSSATSSWAGV